MVAKRGNSKLGDVLACKRSPQSRKISNTALDGTPYVQTTGTAVDKRAVAIYCDTPEKRYATDDASNDGALISVEWNNETLYGFIDNDVTWREWKDEHGVGKFTFIVKEVVT